MKSLKLHLGCGGNHFEGYINVDIIDRGGIDILADVRHLPFVDNSVQLVESYHLIEHIWKRELLLTLKEWWRVLMPNGKMITEFPDFDRACQHYLIGDKEMLDIIYGGQRFPSDVHYFGYNFRRLKKLLEQAGFSEIVKKSAKDYHTKNMPCLRVECKRLK